ncbi:MAG TPA: hypothetical protein VGO55_17640 [Allosphingosinicella sp.]|jgi:hypothetical protein|nr:hypothetical protein [Allosphingosinicella sp.]
MRLRLLIAATALSATQPAAAGIVAHYRLGQGPEQRLMVVEINDRGDGRMDMGDWGMMLMLDGIAYVVDTDSEGTYTARLEDVLSISMEAWDEADGHPRRDPAAVPVPPPTPAPPQPQVALMRGGTETVAGHSGTVWRIRNPAAPADGDDEDFVVSADPGLAPLNVILGPRPAASADPGLDPNGYVAAIRAIYRQGAILRRGRHLRLERVEIRPMPGAFALPGPTLSREALATRRQRTGLRRP